MFDHGVRIIVSNKYLQDHEKQTYIHCTYPFAILSYLSVLANDVSNLPKRIFQFTEPCVLNTVYAFLICIDLPPSGSA